VRVEEGQLLSPMRRIVGGIQVDCNEAGFASQSLAMMFDDNISQLTSHLEEVFA